MIAVKMMKNNLEDDEIFDITSTTLREINILASMKHSAIIKMLGYWYDSIKQTIILAMELMDMDLFTLIENKEVQISKNDKRSYIAQFLRGVEYLHSMSIVHRDLNPKNILITNGDVKICDFGLARKINGSTTSIRYSNQVCSIHFRAIELLLGESKYGFGIDVWSCACLIGYVLQRKYLFNETLTLRDIHRTFEMRMIDNIFVSLGTPSGKNGSGLRNLPGFENPCPSYSGGGFVYLEQRYPAESKLMHRMLSYDIGKRPNMTDVVTTWAFTDVVTNQPTNQTITLGPNPLTDVTDVTDVTNTIGAEKN